MDKKGFVLFWRNRKNRKGRSTLDTIDKMAACDAEGIREILADLIKKTGFRGVLPTAGKAQNAVSMARYLKRKVLF